jgi:hypothetical protein
MKAVQKEEFYKKIIPLDIIPHIVGGVREEGRLIAYKIHWKLRNQTMMGESIEYFNSKESNIYKM